MKKGILIRIFILFMVALSVSGLTACGMIRNGGAPVFSVESGFYADEFELKLSTVMGREIYYTVDGSDPRTSDTAIEYDASIRIYDNTKDANRLSNITDITLSEYYPPKEPVEKGMIIRAVSKGALGNFSEVVTHSYFVGKEKDYYSEMRVISLVVEEDDLFDPDTGRYMVGSGYYEWLKSDDYQEYDPGDVNNPTNYNQKGKETEFPVLIQVFEGGKEVFRANVGARISGNWSRAAAQKSFRLYARKEYGTDKMQYAFFDERTNNKGEVIQSYDKVTLRNSGNDNQTLHFRDAFFQELVKGLETDYMASEPCVLFLNGEFWGFYLLREKPEDEYIESLYGIDKKIVAVLKNGDVESGDDSDAEEFRDLCSWAQSADMRLEENYTRFCESVDLQSFMDYLTVQTYLNNADWMNGYANNWMVWRTKAVVNSWPKADGKWRFILYDLDYSAGLYNAEKTSYTYDGLSNNRANGSVYDFTAILDNLMTNPEFALQFRENYLRIMDECFAPDVVDALLNRYVDAYREVTEDTFYRFGMGWAAENYDSSVAHMREFFYQRPTYAAEYLKKYCETDRSGPKPMLRPVEQWGYYGEAEFVAKQEDNAFCVSVKETTPDDWNIQCQIHNVPLTRGKEYRITFKASCTTPGEMSLGINRFDDGAYPTCFWEKVYLTEELREYSVTFTMKKETNYDWYLNFNFGGIAGDYVIQDVVMEEITQ